MAKIYRDDFGVPHISASSFQDAAKAIAYAHSEDDFFTLQSWFLAIKQKAGHHDDWDGPYLDFLSVFFNLKERTCKLSSLISDEYRKLSECYCEGINLYAKQHEDEILDNSIFPVACEDLFQVQHLMEVIGIQIDKPYSYLSNRGDNEFPHKEGSNIIAISAEKSCNSNSLIAISPHQMLEGIFSYYEIHISVQDNYHLDCTIFPLTKDKLIVASEAFTKKEIKQLENIAEIIPITIEQAHTGLTNSVRCNNYILNASDIDFLSKRSEDYRLERAKNIRLEEIAGQNGMEVCYFNMEEFLKGGALLSCTVLHMNRHSFTKDLL